MIGIVIAITAAIIYFVLKRKEELDGWDKGFAIFLCVCLAIVVDLISWGIFTDAACEYTETVEIVSTEKLVALQDNSTASGSFFLGSGSVDNESYYAFYYETENGFKYKTLDAESETHPVYIKYISTESAAPCINQYAKVARYTLKSDTNPIWFSIIAWLVYGQGQANPGDIVMKSDAGPGFFESDYDSWRYEICIPEGSIKTGYIIDLE